MERRRFVKSITAASVMGIVAQNIGAATAINQVNKSVAGISPRAITMWNS